MKLTLKTILTLMTLITAPAIVNASDAPETEISTPAPQVKVRPASIEIELPGESGAHVAIYALTGQLVKQFDAEPGITVVDLPAGYYIVRIGHSTVKVAVK